MAVRQSNAACQQKAHLLALWSETNERLTAAVKALSSQLGKTGALEYEQARREVAQARLEADNVRVALEIHRAEHGC